MFNVIVPLLPMVLDAGADRRELLDALAVVRRVVAQRIERPAAVELTIDDPGSAGPGGSSDANGAWLSSVTR